MAALAARFLLQCHLHLPSVLLRFAEKQQILSELDAKELLEERLLLSNND